MVQHVCNVGDALTYNGGTTTSEAMWQGVPTLAVYGDRWVSRTSASLLMHSPLREFVVGSTEDYIAKAVEMSNESSTRARLSDLRSSMRDELCRSSVCDMASLVRDMERLFMKVTGSGSSEDSL